MPNREIGSNIEPVQSINPQNIAASANGAGIDLRGFDAAEVIVHTGLGTLLTGSNYYEFQVEESDDDITYAAVADTDLTSTVTGSATGTIALIDDLAEDNQAYKSGYIGSKRYIRAVANEVGTGASIVAGVSVIKGKPANAPV